MRLYSPSRFGNMYADFVMIVAKLCKVNIEEVVVEKGSQLDKKLTAAPGFGTYPILEIDANTRISDSAAIATYIAQVTGNNDLLGKDGFSECQVDQWMEFLRQETTPLVNAISWITYGHLECDNADFFNTISGEFKENIKMINKHLNGKKFMVGDTMTICDIYMVLSLIEMQQCLMDPNLKNSLNQVNTVFKNCCEMPEFKNRIGTIKAGKSHIKPPCLMVAAKPAEKEIKAKAQKHKDAAGAGGAGGKKKKETKKADDDDMDLFGDDNEEDLAAAKKAAEAAKAGKKKKEKPPEMSLIIFEVKPVSDETDLDVLAKRIFAMKQDGLIWKHGDYKKVPVAFGIFKLILGFSCEDSKISVDDVQEKVEALEDMVQSVEIASFTKI